MHLIEPLQFRSRRERECLCAIGNPRLRRHTTARTQEFFCGAYDAHRFAELDVVLEHQGRLTRAGSAGCANTRRFWRQKPVFSVGIGGAAEKRSAHKLAHTRRPSAVRLLRRTWGKQLNICVYHAQYSDYKY